MSILRWISFSQLCFLITIYVAQAAPSLIPNSKCDQIIDHSYYKLCYLNNYRLSLWAFHDLTAQGINGNQRRTDNYRSDPKVNILPVEAGDYRRTGFDRGHLVPAADMRLNYQAMSQSFFMSNMTPQRPGFNRGIWQSLERLGRSLVLINGDALVVTAPVLKPGLESLKGGIAIPDEYYKILYWPKTHLALAFLIPNQKQSGLRPSDFQVTIDELERKTGIDFFAALPDELEDSIEATISRIPTH